MELPKTVVSIGQICISGAFAIVGVLAIAADAERPPNVVFILADDLGWSELGCYGNGFNETPHLDDLATRGIRFTQAYAAAPVCSPYRASLLTGQHPARIGILDYLRPNSANALSTEMVALPEVLSSSGYATGMVGKWHLTGYHWHNARSEIRPRDHGFQWDVAREVKGVGNGANFWPYVFRDQSIRWLDIQDNRLGDDEFLVDRMNLEAVEFIERNQDKPFFLYLSHYAPHSIMNGKPKLVSKYIQKHPPGPSHRKRCYLCEDHGVPADNLHHWASDHNPHLAAMLESIDDGVGMIVQKLDQLGLTNDTIIVFTSDNGGESQVTTNGPLRGGKSQLYEGGIRVPQIVCWPGRVQAGKTNATPTNNTAFYPTILEAANLKGDSTHRLDGRSELAAWTGATDNPKSSPNEDSLLYWHYPLDRPHFLGGRSSGAVRDGDWKLIEFFDTNTFELYNLASDPSETKNLSSNHPNIVRRLADRLAQWRFDVGARMPSPPLLTTPIQLQFGDTFSPKQLSTRWFLDKEWNVQEGRLVRNDLAAENDRIFLKDATFEDVLIRFDFQFRGAHDIRLVAGASGHYNFVIHIHRDHFYIQTAQDSSGPYFSYRHDECAFQFQENQWYTMTVEIVGDKILAHIDGDHAAFGQHPILDKKRTYFAFQVDQAGAAFDNVEILTVKPKKDFQEQLKMARALAGRYVLPKSYEEAYQIRKRNIHDQLYRSDAKYRELIAVHEDLKRKEKTLYPQVFKSHKEFQKEIAKYRKELLAVNADYKRLLGNTHQAKKAIESYVLAKTPSLQDDPKVKRGYAFEQARKRVSSTEEYKRLEQAEAASQRALQDAFPRLFTTNQQISQQRKAERLKLKDDPKFKNMLKETSEAYRTVQDYLHNSDPRLKKMKARRDTAGSK